MTPTEEARRIDFLNFLLDERDYPKENIAVEVVILKKIGHGGKNNLRSDVIVYDKKYSDVSHLSLDDKLKRIVLIAEIKRESKSKSSGVEHQLEPSLRIIPSMNAVGVYWDDKNRDIYFKQLTKGSNPQIEIHSDSIANLPVWGYDYKSKPIIVSNLTKPTNLVGTLYDIANIMRSNGVNDETLRYKETVKLLLARYIDEKQAKARPDKVLQLQVYEGNDSNFINRLKKVYEDSSKRYSNAKTLFSPVSESELNEETLKSIVKNIQGFDLSSASNETMQQIFMSFVPVVFKKSLDQYFTPISLIETIVSMVDPGPTDKIADPAMGTADFLSAAMAYRSKDDDISQRVFGIDKDQKAFDLAMVNMILNRDGQSGLKRDDSIENFNLWFEEMDIVLCNPPFGSKTVESRASVLKNYDLGHEWNLDKNGVWQKNNVMESQQLGILFIERCWKMLRENGRLGIILPEGYLCTSSYGYVRQWILSHFQIVSLIELPRRIFTKSNADLRSNILIARKIEKKEKIKYYPIYASIVRKVGYKMGGDFGPLPKKDPLSGLEIRDDKNNLILDSDFTRVINEYNVFKSTSIKNWTGAKLSDILPRTDLDMKPRRLTPRALDVVKNVKSNKFVVLSSIATIITNAEDLLAIDPSKLWRPIEGQDIRAVEGIVVPQFPERAWSLAARKDKKFYKAIKNDIIIGLVRPERRNIGILIEDGDDIVASPDGTIIVRVREEKSEEYPQEWIFATLRTEACRIQFWTESGGTSYGKLNSEQIENVLLPELSLKERKEIASSVKSWMESVEKMQTSWNGIGSVDDRRPILNSPLIGLIEDGNNNDEDSD